MNKENPNTNRFLEEFKSTYCKDDNPTAVVMANMTQNTPPTTGSGMVTKRAPIFPNIPKIIIKRAPNCTTRLLPT